MRSRVLLTKSPSSPELVKYTRLMANVIAFIFILSSLLFIATPISQSRKLLSPDSSEKSIWFKDIFQLGHKEKFAKLHFYVQDLLGGENKTVYEVASASITPDSPTGFGQVRVVDDLLTAEPDINSEKVGRIQGLITSSDLKTSALAMNLNFVFTWGRYNGSTISILGRNQIMDGQRELPVVGGTGIFRFARGYAVTRTHSYDVETNYGVLEYTLYVTYYADQSRVMRLDEVN